MSSRRRLTSLFIGLLKRDRKSFQRLAGACFKENDRRFYSTALLKRSRRLDDRLSIEIRTSGRIFRRHRQFRTLFKQSGLSHIVNVKTGDQRQAGTDANVKLILHAESGQKSDEISLDYLFRDDFERGQLDSFQLKNLGHLGDIHKIELWRDNSGLGADWYVDYIEIENVDSRQRFVFPLFRWIKAHKHYIVRHMDNCLPQYDEEPDYRAEELEEKRRHYHCMAKFDGGPAQVSNAPATGIGNEPSHEKTNNLGFRPGPTQTSIC